MVSRNQNGKLSHVSGTTLWSASGASNSPAGQYTSVSLSTPSSSSSSSMYASRAASAGMTTTFAQAVNGGGSGNSFISGSGISSTPSTAGAFYSTAAASGNASAAYMQAQQQAQQHAQQQQQQQPLASLDPSDFPALGVASNTNGGNTLNAASRAKNGSQTGVASSRPGSSSAQPTAAAASDSSRSNGPPPGLGGTAQTAAATSSKMSPPPPSGDITSGAAAAAAAGSGSNGGNDFPALPKNGDSRPPSNGKAALANPSQSTSTSTSTSTTTNSSNNNSNNSTSNSSTSDSNSSTSTPSASEPTGSKNGEIISTLPSDIEKFGMNGLLSVIRMENNDETAVAIGSDLGTLGFPSNRPDGKISRYLTASWSEDAVGALTPPGGAAAAAAQGTTVSGAAPGSTLPTPPQRPEPLYVLPPCYQVERPTGAAHEKIQQYHDETLFYIFYTMPRDVMQEMAAMELQARNWRFHKEMGLWLTKDPLSEPVQQSNTAEQGVYIFFDPFTWEKVKKEYFLVYSSII